MSKKAIIMVMDGVGAGELPDANLYGDEGSNTLLNILKAKKDIKIPNLLGLGLYDILRKQSDYLNNFEYNKSLNGSYAQCKEASPGKDTTTGHWEIAGIILEKPFPTYPNGFPDEIIKPFCEAIGSEILYNKTASGTELIKNLGYEHVKTKKPLVYTSADSVFQIAAHEEVIPIERQYEICQIARDLLVGKHGVARVIARPFIGEKGNYKRTINRKDFSLDPIGETVLDRVKANGKEVFAVGKIEDIFNFRGITQSVHTYSNLEGIDQTIEYIKSEQSGFIFTNLVEFDSKYGHRNDVDGFANALEELDNKIPDIINAMNDDDLLILTADHGCDPTTISTDHSREHIPVLIYKKNMPKKDYGIKENFCFVGDMCYNHLFC